MGVTHIIRGDDHLTNAARQKQIYDALGWAVPVMAHIPLIHGPDGSKLSKRHGALGVDAYRAMGYLPAALRNYLVRLGWSHGDQEIFSTEEMIAAFDLPQIGRSPARFDFTKLESLNGHYIRRAPTPSCWQRSSECCRISLGGTALAAKLTPQLREQCWPPCRALRSGPRHCSISLMAPIFCSPTGRSPRMIRQRPCSTPRREPCCRTCWRDSGAVEPWSVEATEQAVRAFAERKGDKLGTVAQPLRAALTGRTTSPGIFEVLAVLGKAESLARIADQTPRKRAVARCRRR